MDTLLRPTGTGTGTVRNGAAAPLVPARIPERAADATASAAPPAAAAAGAAPLRRSAGSAGGGLQEGVARAQQALDYLERVAGQLETLKGELTAKLAGSRGNARPQLDTHARQLAKTLAARRPDAGGGVDANLNFSAQPATQRFRIPSLDADALRQNAPQTIAFSVGGAGGPQLAANVTPDQTNEELARAIDRAMAPLGVRAAADGNGGLVFGTPEANWPAVRDSIAVSGRGRVATEEVQPDLAPQHWNTANTDALRQSLREVVQALERVRRSQSAASATLSAASADVAQAQTPPPDVTLAAEDFASAAGNTDYDSLLALTSALVGVSRERVLALLGLR